MVLGRYHIVGYLDPWGKYFPNGPCRSMVYGWALLWAVCMHYVGPWPLWV